MPFIAAAIMLADAVAHVAAGAIRGGEGQGLGGVGDFEPVRSAEPPMVSSSTLLITSSAIWLDLRVATFWRHRRRAWP